MVDFIPYSDRSCKPKVQQEGLCPLGGYMEEDFTPIYWVMLQNDRLTHFLPETANHWTSVTPPRLLVLGAWEKDQEDYAGVINILLSLETNHWRGSQRTGSSAVSQSGSPLHHEAHSEAESDVSALFGFDGCLHNKILFMFQLPLKYSFLHWPFEGPKCKILKYIQTK